MSIFKNKENFRGCALFRIKMPLRVLIRQLPARGLSPHHERVHGSLDVRFALAGAAASRWHGQQRPIITLQNLRHRVPNARREPVILL